MSNEKEVVSVLQYLDNKSILIIGAAGFLGKIFVEKILRVAPQVRKLYLLIRASGESTATERFNDEILGKVLFKLEHQMVHQLDAIINLAATTNFDERYDVALGINTLGAAYALNFAKRSYVCGEKSGLVMETPYRMGETLNGAIGLDINQEQKFVNEKLSKLQATGALPETITQAMKDYGLRRAKMYGWPNTYVFTKAMGEMIVGVKRENMSVVIIRPSIITSTFKEPFPGWTEGIRTIDSLAVGYGTGKLTCFLGDLNATSDVIPADMVVNTMLVSMAAQAGGQKEMIYHVGSSMKNLFKNEKMPEIAYRYFTTKPWTNKEGKAVRVGKVDVLNYMPSFHRYMTIHYLLPLKGLELLNMVLCKSLEKKLRDLSKKINFVLRLVDLYQPYLFFYGIFDDTNTEELQKLLPVTGVETDIFYFDPKIINWDDYFVYTHIPGLVKYVFK
ncbi:predicted protein [Arabidopsis lyrata subsp. lyrata]|uniref:Fatty acyl-CoA reductase n=1 Tax=Arabidopsis lyrata subsp. lyrata TaxID=81972 RepID=D7LNS3_ARALL|nr:predicted protein [Arabidopsis lyrata subsp. lyrata]